MGLGIIKLSLAALPDMLMLPKGEYKAVSAQHIIQAEEIHILVDSPNIPQTEEGQPLPTVTPTYRQNYLPVTTLDHVEVS